MLQLMNKMHRKMGGVRSMKEGEGTVSPRPPLHLRPVKAA